MRKLIGLTTLLIGAAGYCFAQAQAPEIDPTSGITAVALLSGGLLVLRSRSRK